MRLAEPEMEPTPDRMVPMIFESPRLAEPEMEPTPDTGGSANRHDDQVS